MTNRKLPIMAAYVLTQAEHCLKIAPANYGKSDTHGLPSKELDPQAIQKIYSGFEQLMEHKGFFQERPIMGIGVQAFYEMMQMLHFNCTKVQSTVQSDSILDEMACEHIVTGATITLYNSIAK